MPRAAREVNRMRQHSIFVRAAAPVIPDAQRRVRFLAAASRPIFPHYRRADPPT